MGCVVAAPFQVPQLRCGHKGSGSSCIPFPCRCHGCPQCGQGYQKTARKTFSFRVSWRALWLQLVTPMQLFFSWMCSKRCHSQGWLQSSPWGMFWAALPPWMSESDQSCVQRIKCSGSAGTVATAEMFLNLFSWYWKELLGTSLNSL